MKIGIMGGTFNPIHNGHLLIGDYAKKQFGLDEVVYIPNGKPAYKSIDIDISPENRYDMVKLAIENMDGFTVSDLEIKRDGITYTIDTIKELKKFYKDADLYFIVGEDSLFNLEDWKNYRELFKLCSFLVFKRREESEVRIIREIKRLNEMYGADIHYIKSPVINISSTKIRSQVKLGNKVASDIPESVEKYIYDNNLYGDD